MTDPDQPTHRIPASAPLWCFAKTDAQVQALCRYAAESGLALEMPGRQAWPFVEQHRLSVINLTAPGMSGRRQLNREADHNDLLPQIEAVIAEAAARHIPQVIVFSGNRQGISDREAKRAMANGLAHLAPIAAAAGVTLTLEVLNAFDHPDYHADRTRFAIDVLEQVDAISVRLLYDIYHMHRMDEDVKQQVTAHLPLIAHLHLAGSPNRDFPGEGQAIDYRGLVESVLEAGYVGRWGFEFLPGKTDPLETLDAARRRFDAWALPPTNTSGNVEHD